MDFGADTDLDCIGGKSDKVFCGGGAGEEGVSVVKVGFLDSELCQNDQGISSLSEFFFRTNCRFTDEFYLHHQGDTLILLNFWLWFCTVLSGRECHCFKILHRKKAEV